MNTTVVPETARVRALRRALEYTADRVGPLVDATRPYVDGLEHLPRDGRFLLVGNHTQAASNRSWSPTSSVERWGSWYGRWWTARWAGCAACQEISWRPPVAWWGARRRLGNS